MWNHYRRTFVPVQAAILAIVTYIYVSSRLVVPTLFMFVMLQGFALIGAAWGARLKSMLERNNAGRLPLESRS